MTIGLTYTGTEWKHENYVKWLVGDAGGAGAGGGDAISVVRLEAGGEVRDVRELDALVLSGGIDIHPSFYGGGMEYAENNGWKKERDDFELAMLEGALNGALPVLGVCRGLQLINVHMGGTLVQDLGVAGDRTHMASGGDKQHAVRLEESTLLALVAGRSEGIVNSAHHQAIDRLGEGLKVNCRAGDGTIEGIEWTGAGRAAGSAGAGGFGEATGFGDKSFLLAVQWHPERMYTGAMADTFLYRAIRDRFVEEIKKNKL